VIHNQKTHLMNYKSKQILNSDIFWHRSSILRYFWNKIMQEYKISVLDVYPFVLNYSL